MCVVEMLNIYINYVKHIFNGAFTVFWNILYNCQFINDLSYPINKNKTLNAICGASCHTHANIKSS